MFPAGEVSSYKDGKLMVDKPWEEGEVIKKSTSSCCSYLFSCKNSRLFIIYYQN
jgi:hypothetical protein